MVISMDSGRARSIRLEHLHNEIEALRIELARITAERAAKRLSHDEYTRNAIRLTDMLEDMATHIFKVARGT
jgi:hypothetical protein